MTQVRFAHLLDAYGANLTRWPAAERAAALRLIEESADARAAWRAAEALDHWLDQAPHGVEPFAVPRLAARVAATAAQPGSRRRAWSARLFGGPLWAGLGAAATAVALVLLVGGPPTPPAPTAPDVAGLVVADASLADLGL